MRRTIKLLILVSLCFITNLSFAQKLTVYKTYINYEQKQGEVYDEYKFLSTSFKGWVLKLKKDGEDVKVLCSDIWGFEYGGNLFRIQEGTNLPCMLMSSGKICYYENGSAHIDMIRDNTKKGQIVQGSMYFTSENITSKIEPLSLFKIKKTDPAIIECLKEKAKTKQRKTFMTSEEVNFFQQELTRECIEEYNRK